MDPKTRLDDDDGEKRKIPPAIQKLLAIDVEMTKRFVSFSLNFVPIRSLKTHCKFLEVRTTNDVIVLDLTIIINNNFPLFPNSVFLSRHCMVSRLVSILLVIGQAKSLSNANEHVFRFVVGHCLCGCN